MTDADALARCDALAQIAASQGESPVGSAVVLGDAIIGEGVEAAKARHDVTCHAEVEAIRAAVATHGRDLSAATLYTTHEPCLLCSYVIRHHRIARVVIRHAVPDVGGATSRLPVLTTTDVASWGPPPVINWIT
ncbi:tRNA-specific adenosine deaminase [Luteitalea pratensis]|uniref:tRNA-specific adenosine deaminase n=1 Tax=Luteitalea pratensis TaxID=1855912 RepID=A0A143PMW9_LUTPR|nr:nucleoside deaminase [Luteitalea pratensis]AMY09124.1 tRNA-specific adenosine deaminase [Luteitalea pratensis]